MVNGQHNNMQPDFATLKPISNQPDFNTLTPVTEPQKPTGLQAFIQDTAKAFLKLPTTVAALGAKTVALGAEVAGRPDIAQKIDKSVDEGIDYGYFGNVKPISSIGEAVGTGAEIGSYAIGGGGGVTAVKTGLKGLIGKGLKEGLKTGAASGGLFSFGQSMQEAENKPMDVAYNTLFGTALGGVAGGVLGAAVPLVTKGAQEAVKFTKVPELQTKLSEGYQKIFNPTARQIKADTRFGNNSFEFLAQEMPDLPITVNSNGRVEADAAIEMAKQKYAAEAIAYKPIIRNSGKYLDIDNVIANAKQAARKEFDGTDLAKAEQQIENEINAYLSNTPQDVNVTANGKRFVTLSRADDIKSYSWARGKGWGTPEAEVWNDTNNIIGHSIKDAIEKELPDAPIKAMNRRLGQWKNAIDMLEKRNGQVSGSGGKISKYLIKSVGTTVGAGLGGQDSVGGGLTGAGAGFMTASALAALMANPNVRLFAVRQVLKRLSNAGKNDMIKEAEDILRQQAQRYMLPAAGKTSYIEKPILVAKASQRLESTSTRPIVQSSPMTRQATAPSVAPTIQDTINSNIPKDIPQADTNANKISIATNKSFFNKKTNYKIINEGGILKDVEGKPVKIIDGIDTFIHQGDNPKRTIKGFVVSEKSTGRYLASGNTEREAISNTKDAIDKVGIDEFKKLISENQLMSDINLDISNTVDQTVNKASIKNTQGGFIKGFDGGPVKKIHVDDKRVMKDFTDYVAGDMGKLTEKEKFELELAASRIAERYNIKNFKSIKGLANEFGRILDDQGLNFGKVAANPLIIGAGASAAAVALAELLKKYKKK